MENFIFLAVCVSLGIGLLLQLFMDELKPVCLTLSSRMGKLLMYFYMLQSYFDHPGEVRAISKTNIRLVYSCFGCF